MMNPCIVSFFMNNISGKTVGLQRSVVEKLNRSHVKHYQIHIDMPHSVAIDYFWTLNGCPVGAFKDANFEQKFDHDAILFLDIDCIPMCERAIDTYLAYAYNGSLAGNSQRTNHLENGQHIFAAPSAAAITKENYIKLGCPSAKETERSDVLEEYTWEAEKAEMRIDLAMPLRYNEAPKRYDWEKDQPPYWALKDGQPVYGIGTTYGDKLGDLFYHQFQIRMEGMQDKFNQVCESILTA
jgi:hypothetical protein